jgi:DNA-binding GntR family transcriptional regulator
VSSSNPGWPAGPSILTERDIEQARLLMAKIDKTGNSAQRLRHATEFHTVIYTRANRPFFLEQINRARNNLNRYWRLAWGDRKFPVKTQNEHRKILDFCVARGRAGLMAFIERHIMTSGEVVLQYLQRISRADSSSVGTRWPVLRKASNSDFA